MLFRHSQIRFAAAAAPSGFLASLLKSTKNQQQQNNNNGNNTTTASSSPSSTSSLFSSLSSSDSSSSRHHPSSRRIDPKSIKLDLFPGLSKREQQTKMQKQKMSESKRTVDDQQQQFNLSSLSSSSTASPSNITRETKDAIRFPKFDVDDNNTFDSSSSSSFMNSPSLQPTRGESAMSMLSVSRRMGDWEEAMRILAKHFETNDIQQNKQQKTSSSSLSEESLTIGLLAQAAWSCSKAVELSTSAVVPTNTAEEEDEDDSAIGTIEALNEIVVKVIERFYAHYLIIQREDNNSNSDITTTTTTEVINPRGAANFLRATTGNLVSLSEALRSCGGVDLVMSLDVVIGTFLRENWKREGLLFETQRWNLEVIKVFDACDDWEGALRFFIKASCYRMKKPAAKKEVIVEETVVEKEPSITDDDETAAAAASSPSPSSLFQFKKKEDSTTKKVDDDDDAFDKEDYENENAPSVFSSSTLATLIELLNRNGQHEIVTEKLLGYSKQNKGLSKDDPNYVRPLLRPNESAAIGRAFSIFINNYAFNTNTYNTSYRKQRYGNSSSGADNNNSGVKGTGINRSSTEHQIKMPKLSLDAKFYRTS